MTSLLALLAVLVGVAAVVAGGADDSPGLQGIGVVVVAGAVLVTVRAARRRRSSPRPGDGAGSGGVRGQ